MFLVLLLHFQKWRHLCQVISMWQHYCISELGKKKCNGRLLCTVNRAVIMTVPDVQRMSVGGLWMLSACTLTNISASWSRGWEPVPFLLRPHLLLSVLINPKDVTKDVTFSPMLSPLYYYWLELQLSKIFNGCGRNIAVLLMYSYLFQMNCINHVGVV